MLKTKTFFRVEGKLVKTIKYDFVPVKLKC